LRDWKERLDIPQRCNLSWGERDTAPTGCGILLALLTVRIELKSFYSEGPQRVPLSVKPSVVFKCKFPILLFFSTRHSELICLTPLAREKKCRLHGAHPEFRLIKLLR